MSTGLVGAAISSSVYALSRAWAWARARLLTVVILQVLLATLPALQVIVVRDLVSAFSNPDGSALIKAVIMTAVVSGGVIPLQDLLRVGNLRLQDALRCRYRTELATIAARLSPAERARPSTVDMLHGAREAVPFNLAWQASSALSVLQAFGAAAALCWALWSVSPVAALLVTAALLPTLLAYQISAKAENNAWPRMAEQGRIAEYYENQLIHQRSATELAAINGAERFAGWAAGRYRSLQRMSDRVTMVTFVTVTASSVVTLLLLALALGILAFDPDVVSGDAISAVLGCVSGMIATRGAGSALGELMSTVPMVRAYRGLASRMQLRASPALVSTPRTVSFQDVVIRYPGRGEPAINRVSFTVQPGEVVALVGANGAGKSTLVKAACGVLDLSEGVIDGIDDPRSDVAVMMQDPGKFELTVRETLTLGGRPDAPDELLWEVLDAVDMAGLIRELPEGLDNQLGEQRNGADLSGGQWQRLALARVLADDSPVWLLDEPTSAIDSQSEERILREVLRRSSGRSVILVSHRAWTLKDADRIVVLERGSVVQEGSYSVLAGSPGPFLELFRQQQLAPEEN